jgi:EAL domain-containing protein (putative c-di-GMP-specific phosphodiesterase class I)
MLTERLHDIIANQRLTAWFQPILDLREGRIFGFEAVIRGPSDSPLHSPANLFAIAERCGRLVELDLLCRAVNIRAFARLRLEGRLFLNVTPATLLEPNFPPGFTRRFLKKLGLSPDRVVIELTEHHPIDDYNLMRQAIAYYRDMGFAVAIDDLGAGYAGLRLWSELRPDFVKFDRHFIQGIDEDPCKRQFIQSLQEIALSLGCRTIAEGVETTGECTLVQSLGVSLGQGYLFARPSPRPAAIGMPAPTSSL